MSSRNAFTLIELLVVISIILVLMGLLMGGIMAVKHHTIIVKAQTQISQVAAAIESYRSANATYPERLPLTTAMPSFPGTTAPGEAYAEIFGVGGGTTAAKTVDQIATPSDDTAWQGINQVLVYQLGNLANDLNPKNGMLLDPWGKPLRYRPAKWYPFQAGAAQAIDNDKPYCPDTYQLWSTGPDMIDGFGTGDDVTNWKSN